MLTAEVYQWLWWIYWAAGVLMVCTIWLMLRGWHAAVRGGVLVVLAVLLFSTVTVSDLGHRCPAALAWLLERVLSEGNPLVSVAPQILLKNLTASLAVFILFLVIMYFTTRKRARL